jgi:hypothetical protein
MTLEPHPHIKFVTSEIELQPDGPIKLISVAYTDLHLSNLHPNYDAAAVEKLVSHIQAFQKAHARSDVRLRTLA